MNVVVATLQLVVAQTMILSSEYQGHRAVFCVACRAAAASGGAQTGHGTFLPRALVPITSTQSESASSSEDTT